MYSENQFLPISALQHLIFCERQCALIHVERLWAENRWTVEGNLLHKKAHEPKHETVAGVRVARGLWLQSREFGLVGQADIVEFHQGGKIVPVEYKRGKPKSDDSDRIQICAQAICLEEMLGTEIGSGYLYYGKRKRRSEVEFDSILRDSTQQAITRFREMFDNRETPTAARMPKCDQCSLLNLCLPDSMRFKTGVSEFTHRQLSALAQQSGPETDDFCFLE